MISAFESLPAALTRVISTFCEPDDTCSFSATCRKVHGDLRLSIIAPPFSQWSRRVDFARPMQQIMHLPTYFHDRCCVVRLRFGFGNIQAWGPWTRFYIVARPGISNPTNRVRDDQGNEGTMVKKLPITSNIGNYADLLMEPHQDYFLWGNNKADSIVQILLETKKILVCDTVTSCFRQNYAKSIELERMMMKDLHPIEARLRTFGVYEKPTPFFFTNLLALASEMRKTSPVQFFEPVPSTPMNLDLFRNLTMFLKVCQSLLGPKQARISITKPLLDERTLDRASLVTLPPILLVNDSKGWPQYVAGDRLFARIPIAPDTKSIRLSGRFHAPCPLKLYCTIMQHDCVMSKILTPTNHSEHQDAQSNLFIECYEFDVDPNIISCFLDIPQGTLKDALMDMEVYLTVEQDESDIVGLLSTFVEQTVAPPAQEVAPSCSSSFTRALRIFSAAVALTLVEPNCQSCKALARILEDEGFSTTSQGLACLVDVISTIFWM